MSGDLIDKEQMSESNGTAMPSNMAQMFSVFKLQMRLFSKEKSTYALLFLALLIPILAFTNASFLEPRLGISPPAIYLLILLPLMIILIPSMIAGRTLSSEFRNRTVYMTFPLPVTRTTFFVGKFVASFALSLGIIMLAFGLAVVSGNMLYEPSYPSDIGGALIICVVVTFAMTATAFGLGPFFKRGSMGITTGIMLSLPLILSIALPLILSIGIVDVLAPESTMEIVRMIPPFASYQALLYIDSGFGFFIGLIQLNESSSIFAYSVMAVIWGLVFLMLGWTKVVKKEL